MRDARYCFVISVAGPKRSSNRPRHGCPRQWIVCVRGERDLLLANDEDEIEPAGDGEIELSESLAKASQRHADLSERVNDARWRYYVLDAPTISDGEFDAINAPAQRT